MVTLAVTQSSEFVQFLRASRIQAGFRRGGMAEWSMAVVLKTTVREANRLSAILLGDPIRSPGSATVRTRRLSDPSTFKFNSRWMERSRQTRPASRRADGDGSRSMRIAPDKSLAFIESASARAGQAWLRWRCRGTFDNET